MTKRGIKGDFVGEIVQMQHLHSYKTSEKLRRWLELCDLSLELFLQGAKKTHGSTEAAWSYLEKKRENERLNNQKVFVKFMNMEK